MYLCDHIPAAVTVRPCSFTTGRQMKIMRSQSSLTGARIWVGAEYTRDEGRGGRSRQKQVCELTRRDKKTVPHSCPVLPWDRTHRLWIRILFPDRRSITTELRPPPWFFFFFLRSSIRRGIAYVTVFNSSATWAATFRHRGYKCMLVIFVFP